MTFYVVEESSRKDSNSVATPIKARATYLSPKSSGVFMENGLQ